MNEPKSRQIKIRCLTEKIGHIIYETLYEPKSNLKT